MPVLNPVVIEGLYYWLPPSTRDTQAQRQEESRSSCKFCHQPAKTPEACTTRQSYLLTVREGRNIGRKTPQFYAKGSCHAFITVKDVLGILQGVYYHLDLVRISRASFLP